MTSTTLASVLGLVVGSALVTMCGGEAPSSPTTTASTTSISTASASLPGIYTRFGSGVQASIDGQTVVLRTSDLPDHPSPYWGTGNANYEAPQAGMMVNPH